MTSSRSVAARLFGSLLLLMLVLVARPAAAQSKRLTVDEAVRLALGDSPQLRVADARIAEALAKQRIVRGRFLPMLRVEARAMYFSEPPSLAADLDLSFPEMEIGMPPPPESTFDAELLGWLAGAFLPLTEMSDSFNGLDSAFEGNRYDFNVSVSLVQPLTPLYQVYLGHKAARLGVDAARRGRGRERADTALKAQTAFYRALQARAGARALAEAVTSVEAHVERARAFHAQELIGRADLLEAEVRIAGLRGQLLGAENAAILASAALNLYVGLDEDAEVELVEPELPAESGRGRPIHELREAALERRPEVRELRLRIEQAGAGVSIARASFIPEISAIASYQYNEGSLMVPPAWTVGGILSWTVWDWGATYYGVDEARARLAQARAALEGIERGIRLQVMQAALASQEAREQIRITAVAIEHAEEHLRIEQARYEQQHATSTDVLDAQMRLTRARVEHDMARYGLLIALASLDHATAEPVEIVED